VLPTFVGKARAAGLPGVHVVGNQLVDANGNTVVLHGVNRSGLEYACIQGWGFFDGDNVLNDDSQVPLMKAWGVNEVNLGLNEDCWLGINGVPAAYAGANYIAAVKHEVATLESYNIYPVISLFWEGAGTTKATDQTAMPDNDHAPALWQSVANTFKNDPDVIFRVKEEPYPAGNSDTTAAWQCWKNGDVQYGATGSLTPISNTANCSEGYKTVGMQSLVNIIRGTGATNVIQVPGIQYANTMDQFLTYAPSDPNNNLMGVVDLYPNGNICNSTSCYNSQYAPVIAKYPFLAGEFGESVDGSDCATTAVDTAMAWFDQHGAGYSAWSWDTWGGCLQLITSYSTGAPNGAWGNDYKSHLLSLPSGTAPTATPTHATTATPTPTGSATSTPTKTATPTVSPTSTPTSGGSSSSMAVYTKGAMGSGFSDGSFAYSSKNACDTSMYTSAPCSYDIAYNAWGGLGFTVSGGSMVTSGYSTLQYKLNPNGQPITDFGALLTDTSGAVINELALASANVTALSGGWYQVTLPLAQLNLSNVAISGIQLKNELDTSLAAVHYDDVFLMGSASPTATPTATRTPAPPTATSTSTPVPLGLTFGATSASLASVLPKQYEKLTGSLQFNKAMTGVTITYRVLNSAGNTVYTYSWVGQTFSANTARTYSVNWRIPSNEPLGAYTFTIKVTNGGTTVYGTDSTAGAFTVV
jgi:hypothetical protein